MVASWFLGEERSGKCEDVDEKEQRMATFLGEVLDLVLLSRVWSYLERSEDVDEVEVRATTFSVEVLDLVMPSRVGVLS